MNDMRLYQADAAEEGRCQNCGDGGDVWILETAASTPITIQMRLCETCMNIAGDVLSDTPPRPKITVCPVLGARCDWHWPRYHRCTRDPAHTGKHVCSCGGVYRR